MAERGDAAAQYNLGVCYHNGDGVEEDAKEAVKWFRKAAAQGNATPQYHLGLSLVNGHGTPTNVVGGSPVVSQSRGPGAGAGSVQAGGLLP